MEVVQTSAFWLSLLAIIGVNILLSGDNAVVIALASRSLPDQQKKQAIIWGSVAAIAMRVVLTLFAARLLELPWLKMIGAVLLLWIGVQLLDEEEGDSDIQAHTSIIAAIRTILVADLVMSLDNVLAVAGAANTAPPEARTALLIIGLALSIPIVVFGSSIVLWLMERFPIIVVLGAMLLGWIAGEMLSDEPGMESVVHMTRALHYTFAAVGAVLVLAIAKLRKRRALAREGAQAREESTS
ncbi:MAG: TerC family protein [Rhodocyclaceae bacterium]|jgi:YjbE family integral membrane protein